jgi:hypothetical protein
MSSSHYDSGDHSFSMGGSATCTIGTASQQKQYYLSSFAVDGNARLTVQGGVEIYCDGDFLALGHAAVDLAPGAKLFVYVTGEFSCTSSAQINNPGRPQDLLIYSDHPSSDTSDFRISLASNADLVAMVYAPKTAIEINSSATILGAIRGKFVAMTSSASFSYDEDLANLLSQPAITGFSVILKRRR